MTIRVELVSAERRVWSGEASIVLARTTDGDLGVMANHTPTFGVLVNGVVTIRTENEGEVKAAVHGGFLSVSDNRVSILAEIAELGTEIDVNRAKDALARAQRDAADDLAEARAQTRIAAAAS
jgi:F-type H+-transporting ATPase subunit epsilon